MSKMNSKGLFQPKLLLLFHSKAAPPKMHPLGALETMVHTPG